MNLEQNHIHEFSKYKDRILEWVPNDSKKNFTKSLKENPKDRNLLHYKENPIRYKLNNYGFRTNIDFKEGIEGNIFLGCSHTFGTGHYIENTWSYKTNKAIGGNFLNLSVPGTGIGTCSRLLEYFKNKLKAKNIFILPFHPYRYEYYDPHANTWLTISPSYDHLIKGNYRSSIKRVLLTKDLQRLLLDDNNMKTYYSLHIDKIKNLANEMGARLITVSPLSKNEFYTTTHSRKDKRSIPFNARDNHMPVAVHNEYTNIALHNYNNNVQPNINPYTLQLNEPDDSFSKPLM